MDRRDFLAFSSSALTAAMLPGGGAAAEDLHFIDAHCHVFNARDLPVVGFVEKVVAHGHADFRKIVDQLGSDFDYFVKFLAQWLQGAAGEANKEADRIATGKSPRGKQAIADAEVELLRGLAADLMGDPRSRRRVKKAGTVIGSFIPRVVIGYMHRDAFPDEFDGDGPMDNSDGAFSQENWSPPLFLAQNLYAKAFTPHPRGLDKPLSRYIRWGLQLTRDRVELVRDLQDLHRDRAVLATPALVDFTNWLGDDWEVGLADQIAAMGKISAMPGSMRVHGFAPFDPLREALDRLAGKKPDESALGLVKSAIASHGFIGVKVYPPMGFLPLDNHTLLDKSYGLPKPTVKRFKGARIGAKLDEALVDLYAWCEAEGVAILAHAAESNGSSPGFDARAAPANWTPVFRRFPKLRVCLAHFGHFDRGLKPGAKLTETWEWQFVELIRRFPDAPIYGDFSYWTPALLGPKNNVRKEIARMLGEVRKQQPSIEDRIMFGTDWNMLGQEARFYANGSTADVAGAAAGLLTDSGFSAPAIPKAMRGNAVAFLGLGKSTPPSKSRARLEAFYAPLAGGAGWIDKLA